MLRKELRVALRLEYLTPTFMNLRNPELHVFESPPTEDVEEMREPATPQEDLAADQR